MSVPLVDPARRGLLMLILAGVLWGTGGLLGRLLGESTGLSPLAVATLRLSLGGAVLLGYLLCTGRWVPRHRAAWLRVTVTGLLAAVFQASYFTAISLTSVSLATLVTIGSAPVIVLVATLRTAHRHHFIGVVAALLGLGLLIGAPTAGGSPHGVLLAVLAGTGFALMTLLGSRPIPGLDDVTTTGVGFTIAGLTLAPLTTATTGWNMPTDLRSMGLLAALAIAPTALAYTCYFRGLRATSAGTGSVLALLEPLTATLLAVALLGERLGTVGMAGGVLLGAAMLLTSRNPAAARPAAARVRTS